MERIKYEIVVLIIGGNALFFWKCVYGSLGDKIFKVLNSFYEKILKKIMKKLGQDIKYLLIAIVLGLIIPQITINKPNVSYINSITEKKEKVLEITENLQFDITNFTMFLIGTLFLLIYFQCKNQFRKNQFRKNKLKKYMENIFLFLALTKLFLISMNSKLSMISELSIFKEYFNLIRTSPFYVLNKVYPFLLIYFLSLVFHITREKNEIEEQEEPVKTLYKSRESQRKLLEEYLRDDDVSEILIDGKWGIGKTYFIEASINKERPKVVVDVFLYNDRRKIIEIIIKELKNISLKEGSFGFEIEKLEKYFDIFQNSIPFNVSSLFSKSESKEELKEILKSRHLREKSPIIIIENLDRILEKNIILEIIASLHELKDFLGIKIIVLGDLEILNHTLIKGCSDVNHQEYLKKYLEKFFLRKLKLKEIDYLELIEVELKQIMRSQVIENIFKILNEGKDTLEKYLNQDTSHKDEVLKIFYFVEELEKILGNPRKIKVLINEYKKMKSLHSDIFQNFKSREERLFLLLAIKEIDKNILDDLNPNLKIWGEIKFNDPRINDANFTAGAKGVFLGIFLALAELSEIEIGFLVYLKEENELCFLENIKINLFKSIKTEAISLETAIKRIEITKILDIELGLDLYKKITDNLFEYYFSGNLEELNCQNLVSLDQNFYSERKQTLIFYLAEKIKECPYETLKVSRKFLNELFGVYKEKINYSIEKKYKIHISISIPNSYEIVEKIKFYLYNLKLKIENRRNTKEGDYQWEEEFFLNLLDENEDLNTEIGEAINHLLETKKMENSNVNKEVFKEVLITESIKERLNIISQGKIGKLTFDLMSSSDDPIYLTMFNLNLCREEIQSHFKKKEINEMNKQELPNFKYIMDLYYYIRNKIEKMRKELNNLEKYLEAEGSKLLQLETNALKNRIQKENLDTQYLWYIETEGKLIDSFSKFYNFSPKIKIEEWIKNNDGFFLEKDWNTIEQLYRNNNFKEILNYYISPLNDGRENQKR